MSDLDTTRHELRYRLAIDRTAEAVQLPSGAWEATIAAFPQAGYGEVRVEAPTHEEALNRAHAVWIRQVADRVERGESK